jgi:hypothetical protein
VHSLFFSASTLIYRSKRHASPQARSRYTCASSELPRPPPSGTDPLLAGEPSFYESIQGDTQDKIHDERSKPDDLPPLELLSRPFGIFADDIRQELDHGPSAEELRKRVDRFAEAMAKFYCNRDERRDAGFWLLDQNFALGGLADARLLTAASNGVVYSVGRHGTPLTVVAFRNEDAVGGCDPAVQAASCVAHIHSSMECPDLFQRHRLACLVITIVGKSKVLIQ